MWPFRKKHVVHVDVQKNQTAPHQSPLPYVGIYRFVGDPVGVGAHPRTVPFKPPFPFMFSYVLRRRIKADLPAHMSAKEKKGTVVKIWRNDETRASSSVERGIIAPIVGMVVLEAALIIGIALAAVFIPTEAAEPLLPGAAWASLAVNVAYFLGHLSMRTTRLAEPFEYTLRKVAAIYGVLLLSIGANVAVVAGWPTAWFPLEVAQRVSIAVAAFGLIGAVIGSGVSGAFEVLKWALIEEAQRRHKVARVVVDVVERRTRVRRNPPTP